jgi:hypothetical protein
MKRTVFYSWQSDSPAATNRNLIQDSLSRALRAIRRDDTAAIEPVLDRDTAGVPGSPAIADSIYAKIARADVFVADLTIVNPSATERWTSNPNVLLELGYAVSVLGWQRVVLVQNTAHGGPERLPFDLRGRRVVTYDCPEGSTMRSETRGLLQGRLEEALRTALEDSMFLGQHAGHNVALWWGHWRIESRGAAAAGHLFIREVGSAGFLFDMTVMSGSHNGVLSGFAKIVSHDLAYARIHKEGDESICEVSFHRSFNDGRRLITTEEQSSCLRYHGMGVTFGGTFVREYEGLFDSRALDELDLQRLYSITGEHFDRLAACFQLVHRVDEILDPFVATAIAGAPRGMFTIMEGIVMRGTRGELWAAYTRRNDVLYFTTQRNYQDRLPLTFERWRERFNDKHVIFSTKIDPIPPFDW